MPGNTCCSPVPLDPWYGLDGSLKSLYRCGSFRDIRPTVHRMSQSHVNYSNFHGADGSTNRCPLTSSPNWSDVSFCAILKRTSYVSRPFYLDFFDNISSDVLIAFYEPCHCPSLNSSAVSCNRCSTSAMYWLSPSTQSVVYVLFYFMAVSALRLTEVVMGQ